jgi:hypothetical protein
MLNSLLAALLAAAGPQADTPVEAGRAEWSKFPALQQASRPYLTEATVDRVSELLRKQRCDLQGQSPRKFDIDIPYLVLVRPDGSAQRVVVADLGCPALETYAGSIVLHLARMGDFRPTGEPAPHWYSGKLNFNLD